MYVDIAPGEICFMPVVGKSWMIKQNYEDTDYFDEEPYVYYY